MSRQRSADALRNLSRLVRKHDNKYHVQPSVLIEARPLQAGGGAITFTLKPEEVKSNIDIRLKKNDAHKITHIGFLLGKRIPGNNGLRMATLHSYPNAVEFPTSAPDGVKNQNFEILYTGSVAEIKVGDKTSFEELHGTFFRRIPQTQQSTPNNETQFDIYEMLLELPTPISMHGEQDITITYRIPNLGDNEKIQYAADSVLGAGEVNLVLFALGGKVKDYVTHLNSNPKEKDRIWSEFIAA
jgi:hypothetical protein